MEVVIKIIQLILSLSLLVVIHEFGHFIFARMFGIRVEKFYLFFNPGFSLVKFKIGETEYGIGWIPFGGYVKIAGMIDESMDTEQMKQPAKPDEFRSKPAWQRLLVMVGGVLMNVVMAVIIYTGMIYTWGDKYVANDDIRYGWEFSGLGHDMGFRDGDRILSVNGQRIENSVAVPVEILINTAPDVEVLRDGRQVTVTLKPEDVGRMIDADEAFMWARMPFVVGKVQKGGRAAEAGLEPSDSLIAINGEPVLFFKEFSDKIDAHKGQEVRITYARTSDGAINEYTVPVKVSEEGIIGVIPADISYFVPVQTKSYTFLQSIPAGFKRTGTEIASYWKQLKMIVNPQTKAYKGVGSIITIGSIFPGEWSWYGFWRITALLSIILAVMNILPIPGLDGGHAMFVLYEMITRRPPGEKFMEYAQMFGLLILFALIIFATGNDIYRFFIK